MLSVAVLFSVILFCPILVTPAITNNVSEFGIDPENKTGNEPTESGGYNRLQGPSPSLFQAQPTRFRQDFSTLPIVVNADRVSRILRKVANEEMGVYSMQTILDGIPYQNDGFNHSDDVRKIATAIDQRMNEMHKYLYEIRASALALFIKSPIDMNSFRQFRECCTLDPELLGFSQRYNSRVNSSFSCDVVSQHGLSAFSFYPGRNLTAVFKKNSLRDSCIRWQYFITGDGIQTEFPAHQFGDSSEFSRCLSAAHRRRGHAFIAAVLPYPKTVIILIDHGSGVSFSQLESGKSVARSILGSLNDQDRVAILALAGVVRRAYTCQGNTSTLVSASLVTKKHFTSFLDNLTRSTDRTNHSYGFEEALKVYEEFYTSYSFHDDSWPGFPMIIYISRGLLSEMAEARIVLSAIMEGTQRVRNAAVGKRHEMYGAVRNVQINTVALNEPAKLVMWETQFLRDIASQNFTKYKLVPSRVSGKLSGNSPSERDQIVTAGKMTVVNVTKSDTTCVTLSELATLLTHNAYNEKFLKNDSKTEFGTESTVRFLFTESESNSMLLSAVLDVRYKNRLIGVAGVDASFRDIVTPAIYFATADTTSYTVIMDSNGDVLYHPKLDDHRLGWSSQVRLSQLEDWMDESPFSRPFTDKLMLERNYGFFEYKFTSPNSTRANRNYYWHKTAGNLLNVMLSACETNDRHPRKTNSHSSALYAQRSLTYHRLDLRLSRDSKICYHGKSLASDSKTGVFFSSRAFERSYERLLTPESKASAQGYWAYATDDTRLITNPGLKTGIRNDMIAFSKIAFEWKKQYETSNYRYSIVRRYVATPSGVMLTFPAVPIEQSYDPLRTEWYKNALQNPGKVIVSQPRLHSNGFGYLVTISHTVYEGKAGMHQPLDAVVAVMAVDVSTVFIYKLLYDSVSICREPNIACFLFNNRGYIVGSKSYTAIDDQQNGQTAHQLPVESMHIAHREPSIASDLLQRKGFAVKKMCARVSDGTLQRYYDFNTSFTDVLKNGDGCLRFQAISVPQTNLFLAVVNRSCHRHAAFCPCSVNDRRCLNCHRGGVEPSESWCECPCECPMYHAADEGSCRSLSHMQQFASCEVSSSTDGATEWNSELTSDYGSNLAPCLPIQCREFYAENLCWGVMGCEWCHLQSDGQTRLDVPYCAPINTCFGGAQGVSAYTKEENSYDPLVVSTPIGPVAGGIIITFVLLVAGVYWYRHHVVRLVESRHGRYGSSGSASCLQRCEGETGEDFHFDDGSGGSSSGSGDKGTLNDGNVLLLASFERENMRIGHAPRPRYRPGPRTESSDPGYSTMTGNCDESEHAANVGPLGEHGIAIPTARPSTGTNTVLEQKMVLPTLTDLSERIQEETAADIPPQTSLLSEENSNQGNNIITMALVHSPPELKA